MLKIVAFLYFEKYILAALPPAEGGHFVQEEREEGRDGTGVFFFWENVKIIVDIIF